VNPEKSADSQVVSEKPSRVIRMEDCESQTFTVDLVGFTYFSEDQKQMAIKQLDVGGTVMLVPRPNKWDKNAIEVHLGGTQLGWVRRASAAMCVEKINTHMKLFDNSCVYARVIRKLPAHMCMNAWAEVEVTVSWLKNEPAEEAPHKRKLGDNPRYKINNLRSYITFGRHTGLRFADIVDASYVTWMLKQNMISPELLEEWKRVHRLNQDASVDDIDDDDDNYEYNSK
jgi:hypothetical protein